MEEREKIYLEILQRLQSVCDSLNMDMWLSGHAALSVFRSGRLSDSGVDVLVEAKDAVRLAGALASSADDAFGCESMLSNDRYPRFEIRAFDPRTTDCDTSEFFRIDNNCMHVTVRFLQDPTDRKSLRNRIAKKLFKRVSGAASFYKQQAGKPVTGNKVTAAGVSFDRKIFSAKQKVDVCGSTFDIPRDAEAFFEAQYGPGWEYLEIPAFTESDTHFISTEKSWKEWRSGMSNEEISSYERLLKDYRKENAENRKLGKKVDHVYDVSACCCDKIRCYKEYAHREDELAGLLDSKEYGKLETELMPYLKGLKKYADLGLDLYVDDKLSEIADSLLRALGRNAFADRIQKLIPADRQPVSLTDHHGKPIEYLPEASGEQDADKDEKLSPAQQSLLFLMKRVDVFLRENGIEYFLFGGSLLGAIRHDGFIPWDDDMDIVMTTENYHRLIEISDKLPWDDISFDCFEKDPAFQRPFGMFTLLTDTRFVKTRVFNGGLGMGTGIDVFPMDNVPEDQLDEYLDNSLLYQEIQSDSFINNAKIAEISSEYFECKEREAQTGKIAETQRLHDELEKYRPVKEDDLRVVRLWFRRPRIYKPGMMADPVMHKFEDTEFPVPARAVECLEMQYGSTWNVIPEDADRGEHAFMVDREVSANNYYRLIDSYVDWEQMAEVLSKRKQERIRLLGKKQELDEFRKRMSENTVSIKEKYREFRKEPIKENVIVFESLWGRKYSCNPAALYEYIQENHPEYECVWFLNDTSTFVPGRAKKVERRSEEYYYYLATAKYFIYNANFPESFVKREGQIIVQTMHGTPFKTFGLDVEDELPTEKERIRVVKRSIIWDYLVAQGRFTGDMAWRWFRYDNTVLRTGYPRTDALYRSDEAAAAELRKRMGIPEDKKVILYAPTWRDMDRFDMMLDLEKCRKDLADEYAILIRPHYFVADKYKVPEDGSFIFDGGKVDKIEDLFPLTDILITDYSSVMFDFALTGKPMIFYTYDLGEYTEETRGGYFDISVEAPGAIALDTSEVVDVVKNISRHSEMYGERINGFRDKYLTYENPDSSAKIYEAVFEKDSRDRRVVARHNMMRALKRVMPRGTYKNTYLKMIKRRLADTDPRR